MKTQKPIFIAANLPEMRIMYRPGDAISNNITNSQTAADFLRTLFDENEIELRETFIAVYLNQKNAVIGWFEVGRGGIASVVADIRLIFGVAVTSAAAGLIIAHNHPSGNTEPSQQDKNITEQIKKAGEILNVRLLDHFIVTKKAYYSFADDGAI